MQSMIPFISLCVHFKKGNNFQLDHIGGEREKEQHKEEGKSSRTVNFFPLAIRTYKVFFCFGYFCYCTHQKKCVPDNIYFFYCIQ